MNIGKVTAYIGAGLLAASCTVKQPARVQALEHASKYLRGSELVAAEGRAGKINTSDVMDYSRDIFYWDSLLSINREKEFNQLGRQHVLDSANHNYTRKQFFIMPIEPNVKQKGERILDSIKGEVAEYYTGEEMLKLEKNAPNGAFGAKWGTNDNQVTHYYGELAIKGAERKGFNDGLNEARKELKK